MTAFPVRYLATALILGCLSSNLGAQTLYWDSDGATAGTTNIRNTWDYSAGRPWWSTSAAGDVATQSWVSGYDAVFSAGTNATGYQLVDIGQGVNVNTITVEEGDVELWGLVYGGYFYDLSAIDVASGATTILDTTVRESGGAVNFTKTGAGTLTIKSPNEMTGSFTVSGGTVNITSQGNLSTGNLIVNNGATLANTGVLELNDRTVTVTGTGSTLSSTNYIEFGDFGDVTLNLGAGGTISSDSSVAFGVNVGVTGSGTVTGADSHLTSGSQVHVGYYGTGNLTVESGGRVTPGTILELATYGGSSGTFNLNSGGTLAIGGTDGIVKGAGTATLNLGGGTIEVTGSDFTTSLPATLTSGTTSTVDTNGFNATLSGALSGAGGLAKSGTGTLTLASANSHTGGTTVNAGTLVLGTATSLGASSGNVTLNGGILDLANFNPTVGTAIFNGGTFSFGTLNNAAAFEVQTGSLSLALGGGAALTKTGSGTFTLSGNNSYSGGTTVDAGTLILSGANTFSAGTSINGGTLQISADTNLGTAPGSASAGHLSFDGGTLATTASFALSSNRGIALKASGGTLNTASGTTLSHGGILAGAGALTKAGAGTLELSGSNTYTGGTTVSEGILIGNTDSLQGDIINHGSLVFNQLADGTYADTLSGTGSLSKTGTGTLTLSGTNSYSGNTSVNAGKLHLYSPTSLYSGVSSNWNKLTIASGAGLSVNINDGAFAAEDVGALLNQANFSSGSRELELNLSETQSLTENLAIDLSGTSTPSATLSLTAPAAVNLNAGTLTLATAANQSLAVDLSFTGGNAGLTGGTYTNVNGYLALEGGTGGTGGTINMTEGNITFNEVVNLKGGEGGRSSIGSYDGGAGGTGGAFVLTQGNVTIEQSLDLSGGRGGYSNLTSHTGGSGGNGGLGGALVIHDGTLGLSSGASIVLTGGDGRNKLGGTYGGDGGNGGYINLLGGSLNIANDSTINLSGGSLGLGAYNDHSADGSAGSSGTFYLAGGTLSLSSLGWLANPSTFTGNFAFTGGTLQASDAGENLTLDGSSALGLALANGSVTNARTLDLAGDLTLSGVIAGSGSLTKTGGGTLTLSGTNTYSGGLTVSNGTVVGNTSSLMGNITNNSTVTFDQASDGTYTGDMAGAGSLTKTGAGNLTLSGTNTYAGGTTVSTGTLTGNTASLQGNIANNAAVVFEQASDGTYTGDMAGTGSLTKTGAGNLTLSGSNSYAGGTTVSTGTLTGNTASLQGNITNNATLVFDQASAGTYSGTLSGSGSLTKTGTGSLTLSTSQSHSGGTTVAGGSLWLADDVTLGSGSVSVTNGTLVTNDNIVWFPIAVDGSSATWWSPYSGTVSLRHDLSVTNGATATLTGGGTALYLTPNAAETVTVSVSGENSSLTVPDVLQLTFEQGTGILNISSGGRVEVGSLGIGAFGGGNGILNLLPGGTFAIGGSQNISQGGGGSLNFAGGTLEVSGSDLSTHHSTAMTLATGTTSTIDTNGFNATLTALSGAGGLLKSGAGNLTLSSSNSYSGGTTVETGTLTLGSAGALGATGGTLTLNGGSLDLGTFNPTVGTAIFNGGTFTNGTLDNAAAFEVQSGSLAASLGGSAALTKTGAGTFTLSGTNTYTGGTTVEAGTLSVGSAAPLGSGNLTVNGGTLAGSVHLSLDQTVTVDSSDAALSTVGYLEIGSAGTGSLTVSDGGQVSSGTSTAFGVLAATSGTGSVTGTGSRLDATGTLFMGYRGTAQLTVADGGTVTSDVTSFSQDGGDGTLNINSGGTFATGDINTGGGSDQLNLSGGTLQVTGDSFATSIATALGSSTDSTIDTAGHDATHSGAITGSGALTKIGAGTLSLTGANDYSGATTVSAGTLSGHTSSLPGDITNNAAVEFNQASAGTYAGVITGSGSLTKSGAGNLTFTGANDYAGGTVVSAGTLTGTTTSLQGNIANHAAVVFDQTTTGTYAGNLSGSGSLTKTGTGSLTLSGTNTYSGGTTVSGGTLAIGSDAKLGDSSGTLTINSGATLNTGGDFRTNRDVTIDGSGSSLYNNGELIIGYNGTGSLTLANNAAASTYNFTLAYTGGTGTVDLSSGASLTVGNVTALDTASSTLNLNQGGTLTTAGLVGAGTVNLAGGTLRSGSAYSSSLAANLSNASTVDTNGHATTFSGALSGSGSLTKSGAGTLTLAGTNAYTGGTTVSAGTLQLGAGGAAGSVAGNITNHGAVVFNRSDDHTFAGVISGDGGMTQDGYILRFTAPQTYTGATSVKSGGYLVLSTTDDQGLAAATTVDLESGAVLDISNHATTVAGLTGAGRIYSFGGSNGHLTVDTVSGQDQTFSGALGQGDPAFAFTKAGDGKLTLAGSNTYTGATTITDGTLALGADATLTSSSGVALGTGGTLDLTAKTGGYTFGSGQSLSGSGTIDLASGQALDFAGTLAPGNSPGIVTVDGNLVLNSAAVTAMELAGSGGVAGTDFDQIIVTGGLTLGGTLQVSLLDDYVPSIGQSFQLFSASSIGGSFAAYTLPTLDGATWNTSQLASTGVLSLSAVPEPSTYAALAGLAMLGYAFWRKRRHRRC